ncbi:MAG: ATP-binding protein [Candidatus Hydrothermarchaeaceae archaeon]
MARFDIKDRLGERVFFKILAVLSVLSILPLVLLGIILIDGINGMRDPITDTTETMNASVEEIIEDMRLKNLEHEKAMYTSVLGHTAEMTNITRAEMRKVGEMAKSGGDINESVEIAEKRLDGEALVLRHEITRDVRDMAEHIDIAAFMMRDKLAVATQELKSSVDDTMGETANKLVMLLAIMVVASFLVTILFTRVIVKPIYELTRGAEAISGGDLDYRVNIESRDEFGVLASTFNQMAEDLKEYSGQMEQKVEERTGELKHEKDITKSISDSIVDGIMLLSKDLKIVKVNRSLLDCMGLGESDVIGEYCYKITHEIDEPCKAPFDTCPAIAVMETGEAAIETHIHIDRAGNRRYVEVTAYPVKDEKGAVTGFVHVSRDITERKRMEEDIKGYTEQLEQKVEERTKDVKLERDKLEDSAKKLEKSNELKDLFIDIMRHDLLNPVGVIENCSEFMLDEESDSEKREMILTINKSSERLIELIEDASKYAMLEELKSVDLQIFDVGSVLREALEIYEPAAREKNITVEYPASKSCVFKASPLIKDVISNLLSNAIKYSPENTKIVVEIEKGPPCIIAVKDNGPGIPDEEKERIFERFRRIKKRGVKGSGLGLAIVKRIIDLHGGRAWVEDNPEGGSIFKVELPT